ncbi:A/G-specific adenine glycosylase [Candidatus Uhrbacteria bacterium]|nr:A/G-specific adenine glycosylase [Candidatus Uhrbacteria bacterium]
MSTEYHTLSQKKIRWLQKRLLAWYAGHQRDLPWRRTHDPYKILVSEIMLQQTQVDRVISKYNACLKEFPTVRVLAAATPAAVIRAWSGLGYNRRALYLHRAAQTILTTHKGVFPRDPKMLEALPGVGKYTARAIVCFAFKKDIATADVNILRVFHRWVYGVDVPTKRVSVQNLWELAEQMLPKGNGYPWNHGLMDFGALVCTAKRPKCDECPMRARCVAYPKILDVDWTKRTQSKATPFKDSDRYYRGRIIEYLRHVPQHEAEVKVIVRALRTTCSPLRTQRIIAGLFKDQLITRHLGRVSLPQ